MSEEIQQCPGCGAVLSKDSIEDSDSFCGNINCPFSGIGVFDEWWNKAFCWKELNYWKRRYEVARDVAIEENLDGQVINFNMSKEERIKAFNDEIERRLSEMSHKGDK